MGFDVLTTNTSPLDPVEESVGNDDVSIVCARKYEMVRMT